MIHLDAGQLRTPVTVLKIEAVNFTDGFSDVVTSDALGYTLYVQWIEAHGRDAEPLDHQRRATLRCRYDPSITTDCLIEYQGERWEILSAENIRDRGHWMELQLKRTVPDVGGTVTLWTAGKRVTLVGAFLRGSDGVERTTTGRISTDNVTLVIPQTVKAFFSGSPVTYVREKIYALMSPTDQAKHFTIDSSSSFFALGEINPGLLISPEDYDGVLSYDDYLIAASDIPADAKYQQINSIWDTWRVQSVSLKNTGKPIEEYLEVTGR